jgi:hypothetical protein
MEMIEFKRRSTVESLKMLWPPYRRAAEAEQKRVIRWLIEHPEAPCMVNGCLVPDGYGSAAAIKGEQIER